MTLSTQVLVLTPQALNTVFGFVTETVLAFPNYQYTDEVLEPAPWRAYATHARRGRMGQGAAAAVWVDYNADGPVTAVHTTFDEEGSEVYTPVGTGSLLFDFDSGYRHGTDVHAYLIASLAAAYGPVLWRDEYTGDWHRFDSDDDATHAPLLSWGDPTAGAAVIAAQAAERAAA